MEHANKDLMCLKYALKRGDPVPRFHYEMKTFNIVQCFTELNDNDCELTIVRGINYSCSNPKDVDTYVRFEFPFPSENSPKDRTVTVKDTNNPEYNQTFMLSINRKARSLARVFKRYAVKCEVMAKGGFFHSDHCLGIAQVKLAPLESKCFVHDSFDLMDGRKANGGKLEVKIRIREPLLARQVEQIKEKWVVIDQYVIK
uniref:C2 domain-containing protein n=1 Tax=Strigamia maritima TaxID=126957 RepID=T1JD71_STRMM